VGPWLSAPWLPALAGGPIAPGSTLGSASIFDVIPTLLQPLDLAVPVDGRRRVQSELLGEDLPTYRARREVTTCGLRPSTSSVNGLAIPWSGDRQGEQLEAGGYPTDG